MIRSICRLCLLVSAVGGCVRAGFDPPSGTVDAAPTIDAAVDISAALEMAPLDSAPPPADAYFPDTAKDHQPQDMDHTCTCDGADIDNDGDVDGSDFLFVQSCFGGPAQGVCSDSDTNLDGVVDSRDLDCLGLFLGQSCPG